MEKYTVLTYIINSYECVHEIEEKSENAEYILVTDNQELTSSTWTVIYDKDLEGLSTFDKCYAIRFNLFKYAKTPICLRIDGSILIKKKLDYIIQNFESGQYDFAVMIHPERSKLIDEYKAWITSKNYPHEQAIKALKVLVSLGWEPDYEGLYQGCWSIMRNTRTCNLINEISFSLLKYLGSDDEIERLDQTVVSFVINKFFNNKKVLCVGEDLITNSSFFTWYRHNSKYPIPHKDNTIMPMLFNHEVKLTNFENIKKCKYDNLSSFVGTIKDVDETQYDDSTSIILLGNNKLENEYKLPIIKENTLDNISVLNKGVCEFTGMYWVWKNIKLKDYVMFNQYRVKIDIDDIDINEVFKTHDVILPETLSMTPNILTHYAVFHNLKDMIILCETVKKVYPEYSEDVDKCVYGYGEKFYSNNLFVMKKEDFCTFCEFTNNILQELCKVYGINSYEDCVRRVEENKDDYLKNIPNLEQNGTVDYQSRFLAYMIERLTNIFIMHNFKNPYHAKKINVQKKYLCDYRN